VVFSQKDTFTLMSYQIVQKGPSFPESIDAKVDRETGRTRSATRVTRR